MGIKLEIRKIVEVEAVSLHLKLNCPGLIGVIVDQNGEEIKTIYDDDVLDFVNNICVENILDIDLETGQIRNWKKPSVKVMKQFTNLTEETS